MSSNKTVLNLTSRKKRNGMLTFANGGTDGALGSVEARPLIVRGGITDAAGWVLFRPTATRLVENGSYNSASSAAERNSFTCFMRGFSENVRVETNSPNPWYWRRICFTSKSIVFRTLTGDSANPGNGYDGSGQVLTSNGQQRLAVNTILQNNPNTFLAQKGVLFKGSEGIDWTNTINAPIDATRIDLKSDKTRVLRTGNQSGYLRDIKMWHGMNKNLVYDDDEAGDGVDPSNASVTDKRGMGDYYILDIFSQGLSGTTTDRLSIQFNSTLYWHEK
jgi:hypothetical protein